MDDGNQQELIDIDHANDQRKVEEFQSQRMVAGKRSDHGERRETSKKNQRELGGATQHRRHSRMQVGTRRQ